MVAEGALWGHSKKTHLLPQCLSFIRVSLYNDFLELFSPRKLEMLITLDFKVGVLQVGMWTDCHLVHLEINRFTILRNPIALKISQRFHYKGEAVHGGKGKAKGRPGRECLPPSTFSYHCLQQLCRLSVNFRRENRVSQE